MMHTDLTALRNALEATLISDHYSIAICGTAAVGDGCLYALNLLFEIHISTLFDRLWLPESEGT